MELSSLKHFTWGILMERGVVVDEDKDKTDDTSSKTKGEERIPFLPSNQENSDVELMPEYCTTTQLMQRLSGYLPDAKISVFQVPVWNASEVVSTLPR